MNSNNTNPMLLKTLKIQDELRDVINSHTIHFYKDTHTTFDEFLASAAFLIFIFYLYIGLRTTGFNIDNLNIDDMASIIHTNAFVILSASLLLSFSSLIFWEYWIKISKDDKLIVDKTHADNATIIIRDCLSVLHKELLHDEQSFDYLIVTLDCLKDTL